MKLKWKIKKNKGYIEKKKKLHCLYLHVFLRRNFKVT